MKNITYFITAFFLFFSFSDSLKAQSWNLSGNAGTVASTNFIGTTDNINFKIRTNNTIRLNITGNGKIGIGNFSPVFKLDVKGGSINTDSLYRIGGKVVLKSDINSNTMIGNTSNTAMSGGSNTFSGAFAGTLNSTGSNNTFTGAHTGYANTTGWENTAMGSNALANNNIGYRNSAFGYYALLTNFTGDDNAAFGHAALGLNSEGNNNVGFGSGSMTSNQFGNCNTACGSHSLTSNSTGNTNTALGFQSLYQSFSGYSNVAVGASSLFSSTEGSNLVAIGDSALFNQGVNSSGFYCNTAVGSKTLLSNTTGFHNTGIGFESMRTNTTGSNNTALGFIALLLNESGSSNVAVGENALFNNISGNNNVGIGPEALYNNTNGSWNTAVGPASNVIGQNISLSTAIGYNALVGQNNSMVLGDTSSISVGIGTAYPSTRFHVKYNSTQTNATLLLEESENDYARMSFKNSTGNNYWSIVALNNAVNASERLNIFNNTSGNIVSITGNGNVAIGNITPAFQLQLSTNSAAKPMSSAWTVPSDSRLKTNVTSFEDGLNVIEKLHAVWYNYNGKADMPANIQCVGTIAQELKEIAPYMVNEWTYKSADGTDEKYLGVDYGAMDFVLANAVKQLKENHDKKLETLQTENANLQNRLDEITVCFEKLCVENEQRSTSQHAVLTSSRLDQNNPNPFREKTTISFYIASSSGTASLKIFSMQGEEMQHIPITQKGSGTLEIAGSSLSQGVYTYVLIVDNKSIDTRQMVITK